MQGIGKLVNGIWEILKQPHLINLVLERNAFWQRSFIRQEKFTNGLPVIDLGVFVEEMTDVLPQYGFLDGGSWVTDLILLRNLAKRIPFCNYFEIGTWRGESAVNLASLTHTCFTLNLDVDDIRKAGYDESYVSQYAFYSKSNPNITHIQANSLTFDFASLNQKFDLIFIDGDHHYASVKSDTMKVFKHLVHKDTVVVWHDYAYSPEQVRFEVLKGIMDGIPEDCRSSLYHVSNTLCAIYSPSAKYNTRSPGIQTPLWDFEVQIKGRRRNL